MLMKEAINNSDKNAADEAEILLQMSNAQSSKARVKLPSISELLNPMPTIQQQKPQLPQITSLLPQRSSSYGSSNPSRFNPYSHRRSSSASEITAFGKPSPMTRTTSSEEPIQASKREPYYYNPNNQNIYHQPKKNEESKRFDLLPNGTVVERYCGDCGNNRTSGHWCQDSLVVGGYICQKCYRRRRRDEAQDVVTPIPKRSCHQCQATTTEVWFKHFAIPREYICFTCNENLHPSVKTKFKKCDGCGSVKTTKWATDSKGNLMCRKCTQNSAPEKVGFPGQGTFESPSACSEMEE